MCLSASMAITVLHSHLTAEATAPKKLEVWSRVPSTIQYGRFKCPEEERERERARGNSAVVMRTEFDQIFCRTNCGPMWQIKQDAHASNVP